MSHELASSGSARRGVTLSEFNTGDFTLMFRKQFTRSLDEVDQLLQRQEYLRSKLDTKKAKEIEQTPDLFYNHERFRIWQAKARFRALLTTLVVYPALCTVLAGGRNGLGWSRAHRLLSLPLVVGTYAGSFFLWHRIVGYNSNDYYEQTFAKNVKMLRNLSIRQ